MAGLLRNLITLLLALPRYNSQKVLSLFVRPFRITPLDVGGQRLKSDRYLLLAECAQLDLIVRSGLLGRMLKNGYGFVNAAQQLTFRKSVKVFQRVELHSQVLWFDQRWVYFQHDLLVRGELCARILVKMKFKQRRQTIDPSVLLGQPPAQRCAAVDAWNTSLAAAA
jgi:acyl-CoA thioesterase FadM